MMKRVNKNYRMQLIKEVASRKERERINDPMAKYIHTLLEEKPELDNIVEFKQEFSGNFFDESAGGWVSKTWQSK
jgi:ABC-type oligopeptide transport system ATPase subunit